MRAAENRNVLLAYAAGVAVIAALVASIFTAGNLAAALARTAELKRQVGQVRQMQRELARAAKKADLLAGARRNIPVNLRSLIHRLECDTGCRAEDTRIEPLTGNWQLYSARILLEEVPAADLARLIEGLENSEPAWRVVRVQLRPAAQASRTGPVHLSGELLVEAVGQQPETGGEGIAE